MATCGCCLWGMPHVCRIPGITLMDSTQLNTTRLDSTCPCTHPRIARGGSSGSVECGVCCMQPLVSIATDVAVESCRKQNIHQNFIHSTCACLVALPPFPFLSIPLLPHSPAPSRVDSSRVELILICLCVFLGLPSIWMFFEKSQLINFAYGFKTYDVGGKKKKKNKFCQPDVLHCCMLHEFINRQHFELKHFR